MKNHEANDSPHKLDLLTSCINCMLHILQQWWVQREINM